MNNRFLKLNNFHFKLIDDLGNYINEEETSLQEIIEKENQKLIHKLNGNHKLIISI